MKFSFLVLLFMSIFLWTCKEESKVDIGLEDPEIKTLQVDSSENDTITDMLEIDLPLAKIDNEEKIVKTSSPIPIRPKKEAPRTEKKERSVSKSLPKIKFESELFDFGRIVQGEKVLHEFTFKNFGSKPLVIINAEASCGCTQPIYPFIPIEPGEEGKILIQFNSKGRLGRQSPSIKVTSNGEPKSVTLKLKGEVVTAQFQDSIPN